MKKSIIMLLAVMFMISSVSQAEDLSSLSDADLLSMYRQISIELESRGIDPNAVYTDPGSMETFEYTAPAPGPAEETPEAAENTVLYYVPEGGQYYHADQNCKMVNEKYLPMKGTFLYADLADEPYQDLQPCSVCGAPLRPENPSQSAGFRDAVEAAGEFVSVGGDIDYLTAPAEKDGKFIRMVTLLDDHAKELYMAVMGAADSGEAYEAFQAYAWSLPVTYTEELTVKPKEQAELDTLAGKTVGELLAEGYSFYGIGGGELLPTTVDLSYGLFNYEFEVDASFEQYRENEGWDGLEEMKVKSGRLSGFSSLATNLDYLADGTYEPQIVPHITAEEAAAANQVPPPEEYTVKAWPLDAEGYADLMNNIEGRYGQVYMVKGVVHQVLSPNPLRVIVNTGADGKSQPVMIEYPGQLSFSAEVGSSYRIYADVTSSCYILPVLTARYTFSDLTADPADEPVSVDGDPFTVPNIITAKGIEDFIGEWHYFRIVNEDGTEMNREEMLAEGLIDDHAEVIIAKDEIQLFAASLEGSASVKIEFDPDDGSLKILNGGDELPVLRLADNGMLILSVPAYNTSSGDTTAYLIRREP